MVGGDQEERRQGHGLPHHHEGVGVVGQDHADHAGQEDVVLEAQQARRRALALAEVAGCKGRDAGRGRADDHQEKGRQAVQPKVEGQRRQADRQYRHLGAAEQDAERRSGEHPRVHDVGREAECEHQDSGQERQHGHVVEHQAEEAVDVADGKPLVPAAVLFHALSPCVSGMDRRKARPPSLPARVRRCGGAPEHRQIVTRRSASG